MEQKEMDQQTAERVVVQGPSQSHLRTPADLLSGTQLISFGERITYVFSQGKEVGSVHFDKQRGEIFYKGHNIRNMELEAWQMEVVSNLRHILANDPQGKTFASDYAKALEKILLEKKK